MTNEERLIIQFEKKGIVNGEEFIVNKEASSDFLNYSRELNLAVLGVDSYSMTDDGRLTPINDEICDLSTLAYKNWPEYLQKSHEAASDFLSAICENPNCYGYCFTFDEEPMRSGSIDSMIDVDQERR